MKHAAFAGHIPSFRPHHWGPALGRRVQLVYPALIDGDGRPVGAPHLSIGTGVGDMLIAGADLSPGFGSDRGRFIAGTREPALAPLLSQLDRLLVPEELRDELADFPESHNEIRSHLLDLTGLHGAEPSFGRLSGYSICDIARLLDNLRMGGPAGAITIAAIMAQYAVGNAHYHHEDVKADLGHIGHEVLRIWFAPTLFAARAILACLAILESQFQVPGKEKKLADIGHVARARIGTALIRMEGAHKTTLHGRKKAVSEVNGVLVDLAGRLDKFCFELDVPGKAIDRLARHVLDDKSRDEYAIDVSIDALDRRIDALLGRGVQQDRWTPSVLALPMTNERLAWLLRFDTAGLFRLAILRRFDDLLDRFPWLSGRLGWFNHVPLGLLGALAQLRELGRACEIARELVWRSHEPRTDMPSRLGIKEAGRIIEDTNELRSAIRDGTRAGTALVDGSVSHATLARLTAGDFFAAEHWLSQIRFGRTQTDFAKAFDDDRTVASTQQAERGKLIHTLTRKHDNHYARYYGRTLLEVVFGALFTILATGQNNRDHQNRQKGSPLSGDHIARGDDGERLPIDYLKTGKAIIASVDPSLIELRKFERDLRAGDRSGKHPDIVGAQSVRRYLGQYKTKVHSSVRANLINRHWNIGRGADDRALRRMLHDGVEAGSAPVADLFFPILWFCRAVDLPIWSWLQGGANVQSAPTGIAWKRDAIAEHVRQVYDWAPALFTRSLPTPLTARIASILALAMTWLGLDHKFVELQ